MVFHEGQLDVFYKTMYNNLTEKEERFHAVDQPTAGGSHGGGGSTFGSASTAGQEVYEIDDD